MPNLAVVDTWHPVASKIHRDLRGSAGIATKVNEVIRLIAGEDAGFTDAELAGQLLDALRGESRPRQRDREGRMPGWARVADYKTATLVSIVAHRPRVPTLRDRASEPGHRIAVSVLLLVGPRKRRCMIMPTLSG